MSALHSKMPARDLIEPDFEQLTADDDDDAPSANGDEKPSLDFRRLSDILTSMGARPAIPDRSATPWASIAVAICGVASLVVGAVRRS
jgi:hypothetical protein